MPEIVVEKTGISDHDTEVPEKPASGIGEEFPAVLQPPTGWIAIEYRRDQSPDGDRNDWNDSCSIYGC